MELLFGIGKVAAGILFKFWLENSRVAQEAGVSLDQLIERAVPSAKERRSIKRQFESIADQIGERLTPFFEAEFGGLPENEKLAAAEQVRATLEGARLTDSLLFDIDLEPQALEAELRATRPAASEDAFLSEAGAAFYDLLLRESSSCIVEIRMSLPDFGSQAARTMLARESELIEMVREVLERLPSEETSEAGGEGAAFEAKYRRAVARKLDELELFGMMSSDVRHRYSLSVAYLTLTASAGPTSASGRDAPGESIEGGGDKGEDGCASIPVDAALAHSDRVLIRGEAGSGKTTLLQWIAVNSARASFPDSLSDWNESVPFLIQLRRYVDSGLPTADEFDAGISAHLQQPPGWASQQLDEGRALVLVDGIDELPEERREEAHQWLEDLVEVYPESRYVVTSRPPAVGEDWLAGQGFEAVLLEPLELPAIRAFVDHWHEASLLAVSDPEQRSELEDLARQLKVIVQENRAIRNLASSPLLCAMLCALNRSRRAQLPSDRVELYRIALEMLLERRDLERKVKGEIADIGLREKEILLRVFAWWLLNNGKSYAQKEDLEGLVAAKLEGMPRVTASAPEVVKHLLVRSGLLRQPVEGRVDFIHRTFQEYLAAKEAIEMLSMGVLVEHAHLDQWQEVVILAAGLASLSMREELIAGLIQRGEEEQGIRHRLHLLAVGCLETSAELSPELTERVNALLEALIPPKSMTEARSIASAGEVAVLRLGEQAETARAVVAAACVRALALIGGESALAQLERFGPDGRVTVARELLRAWNEYPAEEFARRVLSDSRLDYGEVEIATPAQLAGVAFLKNMARLVCDAAGESTSGDEWPWGSLGSHPHMQDLTLRWIRGLTAMPDLGENSRLEELRLFGLWDLIEFPARELPGLKRLSIRNCRSLEAAPGLRSFERLASVEIANCAALSQLPQLPDQLERAHLIRLKIEDLAPLERSSSLKIVTVNGCDRVADLSPLLPHAELRVLEVTGSPSLKGIAPLSQLSQLHSLNLSRCGDLSGAAGLAHCSGLVRLALEDSTTLSDLSWLDSLEELKLLSVAGCTAVGRLPAVELPHLRTLYLSGCTGLADLENIGRFGALESLLIDGCGLLTDLSPLRDLPKLSRLVLRGSRGLDDISPLVELPRLQMLDVRDTDLDVTPLADRDNLRVQAGSTRTGHPRARAAMGWSWRTDRWTSVP
jgi:Leucine-rich repeat (LRR) protein